MISANVGGSGLGLHIIKQLLDHIGVSICAESETGVGRTFVFTLPCCVLRAEEITSRQEQNQKTELRCSYHYHLPMGYGCLLWMTSTLTGSLYLIFSVNEDMPMNLAENGQIALQLHHQSPFDMTLTDIDMPVMNGIEMTRKLRQLEKHPVILLPFRLLVYQETCLSRTSKRHEERG
jgi:hypothetical protein